MTSTKRHLVVDETIEWRFREEKVPIRLRIWRAKEQPAVVLVSQIKGHLSPGLFTRKLGNFIYQGYLGMNPRFSYFESDKFDDEAMATLNCVFFETWFEKTPYRSQLVKPHSRPQHWGILSDLVGDIVEHDG